ncbi:substrate-binding domain-containing protein [Kribbia dieselivorans]|uniref:substrate-binding domain-containing protein n=1 Tax=Kribbia dieselivorans TaxID=331526 RepID=UPI0008390F94|nr:substrate-binding domain-containing protein [Kribbia dieselivorans]
MTRRLITAVAALSATALAGSIAALPAYGVTYAAIEGNGSTWSEVIVQQWISDVDSKGMKVSYSGGGSSQGRKSFANNVTDFGITEIPYQGKDEFGNVDSAGNRQYSYLPIVAGGTAFTYQLKIGNQQVRNLRLSGDTIAKIFTNKITDWSDPQISKDNNGVKFPKLPITPVVRSDGSGTTAQFTTYLDKQYPSVWRPYFGKSGLTSYYPKKGRMIAAAGSDQVMNTISAASGNGTIGYVEYSYPVNKDYPVVKVLNKSGYYVEPTQYNVAVGLTKAQINKNKGSQAYLTQILDGVYTNPDKRAYPLSSYSYLLLPTGKSDQRMSTAKRQTLADFLFYSLCAGQTKAGSYGYSPLPLNLVQAGFDEIKKLKTADSGVELANRDVKSCNNPTFDGRNINNNKLAQIAPMPASCDKNGAGPCGGATGQAPTSVSAAKNSGGTTNNSGGGNSGGGNGSGGNGGGNSGGGGNGGGNSGGGNGPNTTANGGTSKTGSGNAPGTGAGTGNGTANSNAAGSGTTVDPETGQVVAAGTEAGAAGPVFGVPTELQANRSKDDKVFSWLAVAELLAIVLLPGAVVVWMRRRGQGA